MSGGSGDGGRAAAETAGAAKRGVGGGRRHAVRPRGAAETGSRVARQRKQSMVNG
jgi:hypothetical protein